MKFLFSIILTFSILSVSSQVATNATLSTLIADYNKTVIQNKAQKKTIDSLVTVINSMPVLDSKQYSVSNNVASLKFPSDQRIDSIVITDKIVHQADDKRHNALLIKTDTTNEQVSNTQFGVEENAAAILRNEKSDAELKATLTRLIIMIQQASTNFLNF